MTSESTPRPSPTPTPEPAATAPPTSTTVPTQDAAIPPAGPAPVAPGTAPEDYVLTIRCPDRPGIVATVSAMLAANGANIEESQQFEDRRTDRFFMRVRFREGRRDAQTSTLAGWHERMAPIGDEFGMEWELWSATAPYRTVIMVSRFGHCLNDLLFRWRAGRINMDIPAIVSNHPDLRELLINRARPYLFSTAQPPAVVGALAAALDEVQRDPSLMERLWDNTRFFKAELGRLGFDTLGSVTPITPVVFGEAGAAFEASRRLFDLGIFAVGLGFPTVPRDLARIRNIVTAEHTRDDLEQALSAYQRVGRDLGVIA